MTQKVAALKWAFALMALTMIALTVKTSLDVSLFKVFPDMMRQPWVVATFIDFYANILILWSWVVYKENNLGRSLLWLVAFVFLGSIATAFYVVLQLGRWRPGEPFSAVLLRHHD